MWEIVIIAVVVLIAAVLVLAATRPDSFGVRRTTSINAAPDTIFPLISDFSRWRAWSPYESKNPAIPPRAAPQSCQSQWPANAPTNKPINAAIAASRPHARSSAIAA